ncbi:MAG: DNA recombination protein RmuC, partial [Acetobacteraceae bacterium]
MEIALILLAVAVVAAALILALLRPRAAEPAPLSAPDPRLDTVIAGLGAVQGRFQEAIAAQAAMQGALSERLDGLQKRVSDSLQENTEKTGQTLGTLTERLNTIDQAQQSISALSGQVMTLERIFSDKQQRGAFAQQRMEAIVADHFPPDHFDFQFTLTNGKRPDCVIRIPGVPGMVVIDSKFPWEAFDDLRNAPDDAAIKTVSARLRGDMQKHVKDMAEKYLIPGEVQTPAIMFVPSESLYAELHLSFPEVIQGARRAQVMIMSPHVFLLALGTIQALMRDARMREQAHAIQKEVGLLLKDVQLLSGRIADLRTHFEKTSKDIGEIEKPMGRI